ncbi:hypothetical protein [Sphingobium yanoikuyae]|uniref:hypothetical protein n=1 Tax=Sphingobium yanoikuyae TaxID=13690 RepID=UPI0035B28119
MTQARMDKDGRRHRACSLILRLWPESRDFEGETPIWRGSLCNLDGSDTRYFDSGHGLCALIADQTGAIAFRLNERGALS